MRIYPSTPIEQHSMLMNGQTINKLMKRLANPGSNNANNINYVDEKIEYINRTNDPPGANISEIVNVAFSGNNIPIYMWYDIDTCSIYFKSSCKNIYLNNDSSDIFLRLTKCKKIDLPIISSHVTNMSYMFSNCSSLTSLDLSNFDTSNVTDMSYMFRNCSSLTSLDVSNFNTSKVINMTDMFSYITLESLNLANFDTSNVRHMSYMFRNSNIDNIDFSFLNLESCINVSNMFENFQSKSNIIIASNAANITSMINMFSKTDVHSIDLSGLICSKLNDMYQCFVSSACISIILPIIGDSLKSVKGCFANCSKLTSLDLSNWNTSKVTDMYSVFQGCSSLTSIDLSNVDTSKVTDMHSVFQGCSSLTSLDLSHFDTSNVTNMGNMFDNCRSLTLLNVSHFNTSNVISMGYMFSRCESLTSLDVSHFDTSKVTNMSYMFDSCKSLTSLDLSNFNLSKATIISMFRNCIKLTELILPITTNTVNISGNSLFELFSNCNNLENIDISTFDTSNVISMHHTFYQCLKLKSIKYGSNFILPDTLWVKAITPNEWNVQIFEKCPANKPTGGNWDRGGWGGWGNGSFLRESNLLSGPEFRFLISNDMVHFVSNIKITGDYSTIVPTIDGDDRVYLQYNIDQKTQICYGNNFTRVVNLNEDCSGMFKGLPELTNIDISHQYFNYNGAKTRNWKEMFADNPKLTTIIYPTNFDIPEDVFPNTLANDDSNPTWHMFHNSPNATKPTGKFWDMGTWNDEGTFIRGVDIDITKFKQYVNNKQMTSFKKADAPPESMVDVFDISKDGNMAIMTWFDSGNSTQYWYSDNPMIFMDSDSSDMFNGSNVCISIDLSGFDTRKTENMLNMFYGCSKLASLDVSHFDTSNVTSMSSMFYNCARLTSLDLSSFDTSKVKYIGSMFSNCDRLTSIDLSSFDTSNVTNMTYMFNYCSSLTSLDLSNFDTSNVTNMNSMFKYCSSLTSLDLSNFDTSSAYKSSYVAFIELFSNCPNLLNIIFSNKFILDDSLYNTVSTDGKVSATNMMYKECPANKPTGGNWDLGTWDSDGTFIKNT